MTNLAKELAMALVAYGVVELAVTGLKRLFRR